MWTTMKVWLPNRLTNGGTDRRPRTDRICFLCLTLTDLYQLKVVCCNKSQVKASDHLRSKKIVAAFRGMHVSPAKHSFGKCDRKCDRGMDRQTDGRTDGRTTDKVIPMCLYASQVTQLIWQVQTIIRNTNRYKKTFLVCTSIKIMLKVPY